MSSPRPRLRRHTAMIFAAVLVAGLSACDSGSEPGLEVRGDAEGLTSLDGEDVSAAAIAASELAFTRAETIVLGAPDDVEQIVESAAEHRLPALVDDGSVGVAEELDRLGVSTIIAPGTRVLPAAGEREVVEESEAPALERAGEPSVTLFVDTAGEQSPAQRVAAATIQAAGGAVAVLPAGDPRASAESAQAARDSAEHASLAIGAAFADAELLESRLDTARTAAEIPGGGQALFPGRRMVAAYGSPGVPSLGILGEQDLDATVERVEALADEYRATTDDTIIPAMEIITTVASSVAGPDGNYSTELDPETLRPWVDRAGEEGIYVFLDLQPGTSSFLEQAKLYEELLQEPHVGLALDPEWRLEEGQRHLAQIGSVSAAEVNETSAWLAELTQREGLPQKGLILHQFSMSMITDREDLDDSHDELAMLLHADGHGTPSMKMATWDRLRSGLPDGIRMAWKNFYDEDDPTLSPEQTLDIDPTPWFVSYQ